ncbi:MAG: FadR family transcriptional regulator [Hyphomicrobiales bacterium]|nr:FadR family transcriptional regulator [Hyphomicrobiales bacterium]
MIFKKIEHNRTADAIVRQVEELILSGILRPGDQLPAERELAKMVDVSRPILRDAIKVLEERGLVVTRHGEGSFVADVTGTVFSDAIIPLFHNHTKATADYLEFRREVEGTAAAYAAIRATEADRTILTRTFEAMLAAHENEDFHEEAAIDVEFHNVIGECTHNLVFIHTLRSCYRLLTSGVFYNRSRIYGFPGARDKLLNQHRAIYDAIMARDSDRARKAAVAHMSYVEACMREIDQLGSWEEVAELRLKKHEAATAERARRRTRRAPKRAGDQAVDAAGSPGNK